MNAVRTWLGVLLMVGAALSGCFGAKSNKGGGETDNEVDPSTFGTTTYDHAVGNRGYRVTGSLTGTASALATEAAVSLDIFDVARTDAGGAVDKADFILDAKQTGFNVYAQLRQMVVSRDVGVATDFFGGVAQNVNIFGSTGVGTADLPQAKAFLFAVGLASIKVNDQTMTNNRLVFVAVTQGLRSPTQSPLSAADPTDLEVHVLFPGTKAGQPPLDTALVPDGWLYYYFETVAVNHLTPEQSLDVGKALTRPVTQNRPPVPRPVLLADGKAASSAVREGRTGEVAVTFDGSGTSDSDGTITTYVWKIFEMEDENGTFVRPTNSSQQARSGRIATYNFTSSGPKRVDLVVSDDGGLVASASAYFYVNQHDTFWLNTSVTQAPSGGHKCLDSVNCFHYQVTLHKGIQKTRFEYQHVAPEGAEPVKINMSLYAPNAVLPSTTEDGDPPVASVEGKVLEVSQPKLNQTGPYQQLVWWAAGVNVSFAVDILLTYEPSAAGNGSGATAPDSSSSGLSGDKGYVSTSRTSLSFV